MAPAVQSVATLEDLHRVDGKAELIGGRIVHLMPTGHQPSCIAFQIARSLANYADEVGRGVAYPDNIGFAVPTLRSGRQSFSPDASYYLGPLPANRLRFIEGPPDFAVEVRSENDYGPTAERQLAAKRADYFEAGTTVVWDVDTLAQVVRIYRGDSLDQPRIATRGQIADAEPTLPGWRLPVNRIFD